jgi:DNA polymerase III epsilon subunit-like protein
MTSKLDLALKANDRPEHDKLMKVSELSNEIGKFLDYGLAAQGLTLCEESRSGRLWPTSRSIPDILARYFGIDQDALEAEKRAMLEALQNANQ